VRREQSNYGLLEQYQQNYMYSPTTRCRIVRHLLQRVPQSPYCPLSEAETRRSRLTHAYSPLSYGTDATLLLITVI